MNKAMWRTLAAFGAALWLLSGAAPAAVEPIAVLEARVRQSPYDYQARQQLAQACRRAGEYGEAFREAAWLAWLAPQKYAQSPEGARYLLDRRARDRARDARNAAARLPVAAVEARRALADSCFDGTVTQQTERLRAETERAIQEAEADAAGESALGPVDRMALAHMYLVLDHILALGEERGGNAFHRARLRALRRAASHVTAVSEALPKAPGAHRTLAVIRARLAELEDSQEMWKLATAECKQASRLDPDDASLGEMMWTLALRTGDWTEAKHWERVTVQAEE